MTRTAVLGLPRIGADRELKQALEDHWAGRRTAAELDEVARAGCARRTCAPRTLARRRRPSPSAISRSTTTCSTRPCWRRSSRFGSTAAPRRSPHRAGQTACRRWR